MSDTEQMSLRALHDRAMDCDALAKRARRAGDEAGAAALMREAFAHEREAARRVAALGNGAGVEPSRGIYHYSAAFLAWQAGAYGEGIALALDGLAGAVQPGGHVERRLLQAIISNALGLCAPPDPSARLVGAMAAAVLGPLWDGEPLPNEGMTPAQALTLAGLALDMLAWRQRGPEVLAAVRRARAYVDETRAALAAEGVALEAPGGDGLGAVAWRLINQ